MSDQQQRPKRPESALDDPNLWLKAKKQEGMEGQPTLRVEVYENNPRFVVKTKVPNDRNNGKIECSMNLRAFNAVLRALEDIANKPNGYFIEMDNKGHRFAEGRRDPNPSIMSVIRIDKLDNGLITLTISAGKNRPLIPFPFEDETYHQFRQGDGRPMDLSTASKYFAEGFVDTYRELVPIVINQNYAKPAWMVKREQQNGGQGGGNWNNRQGGGGGSWNNNGGGQQQRQQPQQPQGGTDFNFDDDIPL